MKKFHVHFVYTTNVASAHVKCQNLHNKKLGLENDQAIFSVIMKLIIS